MTSNIRRLSIFAVTAPGLEPLVAAELRAFGITPETEPGGAGWLGTTDDLHTANLHLRTASRVLVRIAEFRARTFFELERHAGKVAWDEFVSPGEAVHLRVTSTKSKLYHEGAVAQRVREAVERRVGSIRDGSDRADDEEEEPGGQLFVVRFHRDRCTVSADTSGALLHRRGYREAVGKAPLRETLAAAILAGAGWTSGAPLIDPMCGSGTIPIEAALLARRIAPALANPDFQPRSHRYRSWPGFVVRGWEDALSMAREAILPVAPARIDGSDRDAGAITAAIANASRAGVADDVELRQRAISEIDPPTAATGWIATNPPYGLRVGESKPLRNLYAALGRIARDRLVGWTLAILSADPRLDRQLGLPLREILHTRNGGIPVRLLVGIATPTDSA
jgi:putative N6-adenine-specific DNA methylase